MRVTGLLLSVALVLTVFAGLAWLTRHPDSPILERAQEWPVVGPLAGKFRDAYLPQRVRSQESSTSLEVLREPESVVHVPAEAPAKIHPRVWIAPGVAIHQRPEPKSPIVARTNRYTSLTNLEQRGAWYRVYRRTSDQLLEGWVHLEDYGASQPVLGNDPDLVLPLPASPADPKRLEDARRLLGGGGSEDRCGPYRLLTDVEDPVFLTVCERLAPELESLYTERYGVQPVSEPQEAIIFFRKMEDYLVFRSREDGIVGPTDGHASASGGYVALYAGLRFPDEVRATLIHELAHIINRRALGPALPPWLDEGIADDLSESRTGPDGRLELGSIGGRRLIQGSLVIHRGGIAGALRLHRAYQQREAPALELLLSLGPDGFQRAGQRPLYYSQSSALVRFLLSGREPHLAAGFRSYLAAIAAGGPATGAVLLRHLGIGWPALEEAFVVWVRGQVLPDQETRGSSSRQAVSPSR